jgi:zinc transport system ATP-binding protein
MRNVRFAYGENPVLEDVSLEIHSSDFVALIGPNGGGKTTLLRIVLGLLRPDSGRVEVFGDSPANVRQRIGYVPQLARFDADFPATVREVVLTGRIGHARLGRRYSEADRDAAEKALAEVELLELAKRPVGKLSGGERQRTLVARALATGPDLLLLDEPTASIDSRIERSFYELLARLNQRIPIVLVSHDLGFISAYVNRVACLNRRLVVNAVSDLHAHDLHELYDAPVRMWSHDCNL